MKKLVWSLVLIAACANGQNEKTTEPPKSSDNVKTETPKTPPPAIDAVKAHVESILAKKAPKATIEVSVVKGPEGIQFVRARDPKAYPGTGVIAVVFDGKRTYGRHGENKLAALFAERDWFTTPPSDADIIKVVHQAFFNGILILKDPKVDRAADSITVTLPAVTMSGDPDRAHVVVLNKDGSDTLSQL